MSTFLKAIIDRMEGDFLVLKITGEQEIYWPKNNLDFNYLIGDAVNLYLSKNEPQNTIENSSKDLLRKIFQPNV